MGFFDFLTCDNDKEEPTYIERVSMSGWAPYFSSKNVTSNNGKVVIPVKGSLHYFLKPVSGEIKHGSTLKVEGTIDGNTGTMEWWNEGKLVTNPSFRPILRKAKDDLTADFGRFWSNPVAVQLDKETGNFALSIPINYNHWTSVFGKKSDKGFRSLLKNVGWVGVTFGGGTNFGHGLTANKSVTVNIKRYEFV